MKADSINHLGFWIPCRLLRSLFCLNPVILKTNADSKLHSGAALALLNWARQILDGKPLDPISSFPNDTALVNVVHELVESAKSKNGGEPPRVLIVGALGRCGGGAVDLCNAVGLPESSILKWDMEETKGGGPVSSQSGRLLPNFLRLPSKPSLTPLFPLSSPKSSTATSSSTAST